MLANHTQPPHRTLSRRHLRLASSRAAICGTVGLPSRATPVEHCGMIGSHHCASFAAFCGLLGCGLSGSVRLTLSRSLRHFAAWLVAAPSRMPARDYPSQGTCGTGPATYLARWRPPSHCRILEHGCLRLAPARGKLPLKLDSRPRSHHQVALPPLRLSPPPQLPVPRPFMAGIV